MLKYATNQTNESIYSLITPPQQVFSSDKNKPCYILLLPTELLTKIFVLAQNPSLPTVCQKFWKLGSSTLVRAHYLLYRYGPDFVLGKRSITRKIVNLPVIEHLLTLHQCNPNPGGEDWLFINACELNQIDLCRWIIDSTHAMKLIPQEKTNQLYHLLNIACMKGSIPTIKYLIDNYKLNIHHHDETALILASKENQLNTIKFLYNHYQCNIHIQEEKLLRDACLYGNKDLVQFYIENGSNVQAYNNAAIQTATYKQFAYLVKILLEAGANPETNQNVCLQHAINHADIETLDYLISIGHVNPRYHHDWPLKQACKKGYHRIVRYLINTLKDENLVNIENGILLEEALKSGKFKAIQVLLQFGADPNSVGAIRGIKFVLDPKCRIKNKDKLIQLMVQAGLKL